jgi:aryl-phospho-beta-D-glucosidase BglC (GH1 family)
MLRFLLVLAAAGCSADLTPRLVVSGSTVLDPGGHEVVLRGYNWGEWGTAIERDAADNAAQGANSVRLPLRWWGDWKPGVDCRADDAPGHIDPDHLAVLDETVRWATDQRLWTVVFVDSNNGQGAGVDAADNFWTDADARAKFVEVWQFLAARYRDTPYIAAYEILPEPRPPGVSDADVKAFYDDMIAAIRAIDPRTPIVVGPNDAYNLNHLAAAYTTVDDNLIYTGDYFIFDDPLARFDDLTSFRATFDAPVWVNQVGIPSGKPDALAKAEQVLAALDANQIGWAWWTYRIVGTSPDQHGIYYVGADGSWILKPAWYSLLGRYLP